MFYSVENGNDTTLFITENYNDALQEYKSNPGALELWEYEKLNDGTMGDCVQLLKKKEGAKN